MDAPDNYQTTYDSRTKIVVFYSVIKNQIVWFIDTVCTFFEASSCYLLVFFLIKVTMKLSQLILE